RHTRFSRDWSADVCSSDLVLYIGDLLQLPPVIKQDEWSVLRSYYAGRFFFHAHVIQRQPPLYIELTKIYRQTDRQFISILNNLRSEERRVGKESRSRKVEL